MEPEGTLERLSRISVVSGDENATAEQIKTLDSITLLKRCADDPTDYATWHEFLSRFLGPIQHFIFKASRMEGSGRVPAPGGRYALFEQDQQDLAQEVLVRLTANNCLLLKRFRGDNEGALVCYLSVIATSVTIDHYKYLRRQRRLQHDRRVEWVDQSLLDRIGISRDDLKVEKSVLMREIMRITEELLQEEIAEAETRRRYGLIFKLYLCDGLSLAEIARYCSINLSKKGVDKILAKITARLKERLGRRGEEPRSG